MNNDSRIFDGELLAQRRNRAAAGAENHEFLLQRVAEDFAERLSIIRRNFPLAANIGAHHGLLSRRLRKIVGIGTFIDVDSASRMLAKCDGPRVLADAEALPFNDASLDLVVSGLWLNLVNDLPGLLVQIRRALKPDGLFLASVLGAGTLSELRTAWLTAEAELCGGASPRVAPFADVRQLGGLLQRAGFALPVADTEIVTVTYPSPLALMRDIKAMGTSNMLIARSRKPVTRSLLFRACEIYSERFTADDGRVPAAFEIITLTAWAPHESQQQPLRPGSAQLRLADVLGTIEHPAGETTGR